MAKAGKEFSPTVGWFACAGVKQDHFAGGVGDYNTFGEEEQHCFSKFACLIYHQMGEKRNLSLKQ